jgi:hypothetical protein
MSNFISDLKLGQYYEKKYIEKRNFEDYENITEKAFKDYDIKNNETGKTYEIKADRKTKTTGNLFIECKCNGVYSGVNATKANYWIHFVCNENILESDYFYKIKPKKLMKLIKENGRYIKNVGDGGRVEGIIINEKYMEEYKIIL